MIGLGMDRGEPFVAFFSALGVELDRVYLVREPTERDAVCAYHFERKRDVLVMVDEKHLVATSLKNLLHRGVFGKLPADQLLDFFAQGHSRLLRWWKGRS